MFYRFPQLGILDEVDYDDKSGQTGCNGHREDDKHEGHEGCEEDVHAPVTHSVSSRTAR